METTKKMYLTSTTKDKKTTTRTPNIRVVTFTKVTSGTTPKGTPFTKLTVTDNSGASTDISLWVTPNTLKFLLPNTLRFLTAAGMEKTAAEKHLGTLSTHTDLEKKLSVVVGKVVKMSFYGRISPSNSEYLNVEYGGVSSVNTPDSEVYTVKSPKDETDAYIDAKNGTTTTTSSTFTAYPSGSTVTSGSSALQPNLADWTKVSDDLPF